MKPLSGLMPSWVEPDPLKSRATDALGLQAMADRLGDRLLPGLSVLTRRARYFSFLCWARERSGREHDERAIHRYEVALAFTEGALNSDAEHRNTCEFIGSRNVQDFISQGNSRMPRDPRQVYKVPAWRAYRASMASLGLVAGGPRFSLTDEGEDAARHFRNAVRPSGRPSRPLPQRACLTEVSSAEKRLLRETIGLSLKRLPDDLPDNSEKRNKIRRAAFARTVSSLFQRHGHLSPEIVLPKFEDRPGKAMREPLQTLRMAAIWERLSVGLNTLFIVWVRGIQDHRQGAVERMAASLLNRYHRSGDLAGVALDDWENALSIATASLRRAVKLSERFPDADMQSEFEAFDIARQLVGGSGPPRRRVIDALERMRLRHYAVKGNEEAWVRECSDGFELARDVGDSWTLPRIVEPHAYRMAAFSQVAQDLGGF